MRPVGDEYEYEYRQLRRTQPLGPELEYRLRELREQSRYAAVTAALGGAPRRQGLSAWPRMVRVLWPRAARPPG